MSAPVVATDPTTVPELEPAPSTDSGPGLIRTAARRTALTVVDQAISSVTTFVALGVLARRLSSTGFGAVAVALTVGTVAVTIARAFGTDPLLLRHSRQGAVTVSAMQMAVGTSLAAGAGLGAVAAIIGWLVGGTLGVALLAVGVASPLLCLQDGWRFAFLASGRPGAACLNDAVWTISLMILAFGPWSARIHGAGAWLAVWSAGAAVAALVGVVQAGGVWPRPGLAPQWLSSQRDLVGRFAVEAVLFAGTPQLVLVAVSAWVGLAAAGSLRAAALVLGIAGVVANGVISATVPEGARLAEHPRLRQLVPALAVTGGLVFILSAAIAVALPRAWGEMVLADRWEDARPLFIPMAIAYGAQVAATVFARGFRTLGAVRFAFRLMTGMSLGIVAGGLVGAAFGVPWVCWGMAVATWCAAAVAAVCWHRALDRPTSTSTSTSTTDGPIPATGRTSTGRTP